MALQPNEGIHCDVCEKLFFLHDLEGVKIESCLDNPDLKRDRVVVKGDRKVGCCPDCREQLYVSNII